MRKLLLIILTYTFLFACDNKKCRENEDNARSYTKDTALMYLWRYSDNIINESINNRDSGFFSFKPNGDYFNESETKYINNSHFDVWYTKDSVIYTTYCFDIGGTGTNSDFTYVIRNDTLYLSSHGNKPYILIKIKKFLY